MREIDCYFFRIHENGSESPLAAVESASKFNEYCHLKYGLRDISGITSDVYCEDGLLSIRTKAGAISFLAQKGAVEIRPEFITSCGSSSESTILVNFPSGLSQYWNRAELACSLHDKWYSGAFFSSENLVYIYFKDMRPFYILSAFDSQSNQPFLLWNEDQ